MRKVLVVFSALLILVLGSSIASAQIPNVQVYFTSDWGTYGQTALPECPPDPPGSVYDSLYVVASNFNMWMVGIEYYLSLPPQIMPIGFETPDGGLDIGTPWLLPGIATSWPMPQNAFVPYAVTKIKFFYNCQLCYQGINVPIDVMAYNGAGTTVRGISWPSITPVLGIGMRSSICWTVPVEETTWGNIKALYE
jgi:hypothetical protein